MTDFLGQFGFGHAGISNQQPAHGLPADMPQDLSHLSTEALSIWPNRLPTNRGNGYSGPEYLGSLQGRAARSSRTSTARTSTTRRRARAATPTRTRSTTCSPRRASGDRQDPDNTSPRATSRPRPRSSAAAARRALRAPVSRGYDRWRMRRNGRRSSRDWAKPAEFATSRSAASTHAAVRRRSAPAGRTG